MGGLWREIDGNKSWKEGHTFDDYGKVVSQFPKFM